MTERVKIDGVDIAEENFAALATTVRKISESLSAAGEIDSIPTYFEQVTAIALLAFADANVELAILETGLGGRLDATTAANAEIAAITRIDLDHQQYLGETIEEIAAEKAAIIHRGSRVCVGQQHPDALEVVRRRCLGFDIQPQVVKNLAWQKASPGFDFSVNSFRVDEVMLGLEGNHQAENAALAILVALELTASFPISTQNIIDGLERARHPGRLEWFEVGEVRVLLDGAHNQGGAEALSRYLTHWWATGSIALVFAAMSDKDYEAILETLRPLITDFIFTEPKNTRARSSKKMADVMRDVEGPNRAFAVKDVGDAFYTAVELASTYPTTKPALVLVTGSLYLVGEVRKILTTDSPEKLKTEN
jgi:dihydrofolate synthase/folylpolyglutamate synthase